MGNILKDIAVMIFSAGEEIEGKAEELKKERDSRYKKFEEHMKEGKEEFKTSFSDDFKKAKDALSDITGKFGLASRKEVQELKEMIDQLNAKIDKLSGKDDR